MPIQQPREKYFYTVLFLDDYFPKRKDETKSEASYQVELPKMKNFEITKGMNTTSARWIDENTLLVKHGLDLPLTLEMWNHEGKPIFYVPLLKEGIDSISVGQVVIESSHTITLYFNEENPPPEEGQVFNLSMKTLPHFDTKKDRIVKTNPDVEKTARAFEEFIDVDKTGLAIVFRRNNLDAHVDLLSEFDEMYLHSLSDSYDLKYLTDKSKFQRVKWMTMYTDNLQDVLEQINVNLYEIKFSWNNVSAMADDPFGYQVQRGHSSLLPRNAPRDWFNWYRPW